MIKKINETFRTLYKDKKIKYGTKSAMITAIALVVVLALNIIVSSLNIKLDLTGNKLFSLSDQTINIVESLNSDVKIIMIAEAGNEDPAISEILNKYVSNSSKVTFETMNVKEHPEAVTKYSDDITSATSGSLIVESGDKYRFIDAYDLYNVSDENEVESIAVEQKVTGAIMYVTAEKQSVVYSLSGHGESELTTDITDALETENYAQSAVNLSTEDWSPAAEDILIINSPKRDISEVEFNKIKDYLSKGGKLFIFADLVEEELPRFNQLLNDYGVSLNKAVILEGNANNTVSSNNLYLIPELSSQSIVEPVLSADLSVVTYAAQPITKTQNNRETLAIESLMSTSEDAYAKSDLDITTRAKEDDDLGGPFDIAVAITDNINTEDTSKNPKIVVFSSSALTDSSLVSMSSRANVDVIMNSFSWLIDNKDNIAIRAKSVSAEYLTMTANQQLLVAVISVIAIPVIVIAVGVFIWIKRKRKDKEFKRVENKE